MCACRRKRLSLCCGIPLDGCSPEPLLCMCRTRCRMPYTCSGAQRPESAESISLAQRTKLELRSEIVASLRCRLPAGSVALTKALPDYGPKQVDAQHGALFRPQKTESPEAPEVRSAHVDPDGCAHAFGPADVK